MPKAKSKKRKRSKGEPVKVVFKRDLDYSDILLLGFIVFVVFMLVFTIAFQQRASEIIGTAATEYKTVNVSNDIGIGYKDDGAFITLMNANQAKSYMYFSPSEGYLNHSAQENSVFVFVLISVWNPSREAYDFDVNDFILKDENNFDYHRIPYRKGADELKSSHLLTGETAKGILLFELPADAKNLKLVYKNLMWRL
ncbi:hypothetical protein DRN74_04105 [Candidatus Micrarchaeota archaeon]|nr:MAG: hypothetical protein DRN74_04105 [Candidatus Micrarchaeota archaeon]